MDDSKSQLGEEIAQLRELLNKAQSDKKKLSSRVTKLTNNGKFTLSLIYYFANGS